MVNPWVPTQQQQQQCSRVASIVACAGGVCLRIGHTDAHGRERFRPPARSGAHPICIWVGAEGGSRVLGRDSSARCIALVCGSQVREMGPCVGKKLPSHDPDSHFTMCCERSGFCNVHATSKAYSQGDTSTCNPSDRPYTGRSPNAARSESPFWTRTEL